MLFIMSISTSLICFFNFQTLHLLNQQKQQHETTKSYQIIAGSLAFVQPIIILFVTLLIILCKNQKNYYSKALFILKDYININFLIGFCRIIALLMACFQSSQISDKSSVTSFFAIVGLLGTNFCLAEYMSMLEMLGVMNVGVEKDLGFLEINIACALCGIQNLYGLGKWMILVFFTCMFLNQVHNGVAFSCSDIISKIDEYASSIEHDVKNGVDAGVQVPASKSVPA